MDLKKIGINMRGWVESAQDRDYCRALLNSTLILRVQKAMELVIIIIIIIIIVITIIIIIIIIIDRLICLGVSVPDYFPRGRGFDSWRFHNFECGLGLKRGPQSREENLISP